ncbi:MAG: hypothetical protein GY745_01985 [Actinomycetia bacterium]|nr:hypothetical protein [Actinomycetes bacterium]
MTLIERIVALHRVLGAADIPHAFGGALALAWCTQRARATIDIDVNLFLPVRDAERVWAALPEVVEVSDKDRLAIEAEGQTRLWWGQTPVDVFFNTTDYHEAVGGRARVESFGGEDVPFLACRDLAVFKAFYDRTKDWADLEEMAAAGSLDVEAVLGVLTLHLGGEDPRVERVRQLGTTRAK